MTGGFGGPGRAVLADREPPLPAIDARLQDVDPSLRLATVGKAFDVAIPDQISGPEPVDDALSDADRGGHSGLRADAANVDFGEAKNSSDVKSAVRSIPATTLWRNGASNNVL